MKRIIKNDQSVELSRQHQSFYRNQQLIMTDPEIYQSDSSEFSDVDYQDHMLHGEAALVRFLKRHKKASKIVEHNLLRSKEDMTSHLVAYLDYVNRHSLVPRLFNMVNRHNKVNIIDCHDTVLNSDYAAAFSQSLKQARFVNVLNLRNTNLDDDKAIQILSGTDKAALTRLDVSQNPRLTSRFYSFIAEMIDDGCNL
jgi:hypothetical protein